MTELKKYRNASSFIAINKQINIHHLLTAVLGAPTFLCAGCRVQYTPRFVYLLAVCLLAVTGFEG